MRVIDADKFILALMDASLSSVDEDTILDLIDSVPTVDAVPVVRCKDCKHEFGGSCIICGFQKRKPDDFCSYGKRKEGAEC